MSINHHQYSNCFSLPLFSVFHLLANLVLPFLNPVAWLFGEGNGTPLQYSCLENPMDKGTLWAAVHGVAKSQTWLSDFTFTFHFHALEKEMATHSSVLAWRIPGTGEPGGLLSVGSHRVGHNWSDSAVSSNEHVSEPTSQVIPPPPLSPWCPYVSSRLCLYFCFADKIIYAIFVDSTHSC